MRKVSWICFLFWMIVPDHGLRAQQKSVIPCKAVQIEWSLENLTVLKEKMDQLVASGVPGFVIGVESPTGSYYGASGFAQLENKVPMGICHLQYLQSISKLYLAVSILQYKETGAIDLDQPIANYIPSQLADWVVGSDRMTVRMLLNHTSGIPEYNYLPEYVSVLLQSPDHKFVPEDYIELIKGKELDFEPGSKYSYRNSGFVLLALMMDHLTGNHAEYIQTHVFDPLGLENTFYRNDPDYLNYSSLVNGYWDRFGNGIIENSSHLQVENVSKLAGDDGIVTTPKEAILFLQALMKGKLISEESLQEMKSWVLDSNGNPAYGLGLDYSEFGGEKAFGHSGGGLGAGSQLYYFPENDLYFFMAINLATVTDSPIHQVAEPILNEIYKILVKD